MNNTSQGRQCACQAILDAGRAPLAQQLVAPPFEKRPISTIRRGARRSRALFHAHFCSAHRTKSLRSPQKAASVCAMSASMEKGEPGSSKPAGIGGVAARASCTAAGLGHEIQRRKRPTCASAVETAAPPSRSVRIRGNRPRVSSQSIVVIHSASLLGGRGDESMLVEGGGEADGAWRVRKAGSMPADGASRPPAWTSLFWDKGILHNSFKYERRFIRTVHAHSDENPLCSSRHA